MATTYATTIQQLYVTYLSRPADPDGLNYWEAVVEAANGSTDGIAAAFAQSAEYKQLTHNMGASYVVYQLYESLFGRPPDAGGQSFWVDSIEKGGVTIDQAATAIVAGAQGADLQEFQLKVAAASDFTSALDTVAKVQAYESSSGVYWGQYYLGQVSPANPHPSFDEPVVTTGPIPSGVELVGVHLS